MGNVDDKGDTGLIWTGYPDTKDSGHWTLDTGYYKELIGHGQASYCFEGFPFFPSFLYCSALFLFLFCRYIFFFPFFSSFNLAFLPSPDFFLLSYPFFLSK